MSVTKNFLDSNGLTTYDNNIKNIINSKVAKVKVNGSTITPDSSGEVDLGNIASNMASASADGLMSKEHYTKLENIAAGAEVNVQADWNQTTTTADDYIKNKPTLATVATSGSYNDLENKPNIPTYSVATQSTDGLLSSTDKTKLDGIATGAEVNQNAFSNITVGTTTVAADSKTDTLTLEAGNNVTLTLDETNDKITIASSYTDTNTHRPVQMNSTQILGDNTTALNLVAGTNVSLENENGTGKVTISASQPSVGNGTITVQKNGTTVKSFTTNQSSNETINITVPTSASDVSAIATSAKGAANGVAELDSNGKVPTSQLPSYVDDVLEYTSKSSFPTTGETGKIYVDTSTNLTYRWSGTDYIEISPSLALGETSSTAYRGDRGKIAYDHSQSAHAPSNAQANQNAFSNVTIGSTTIAADTTTDTLTLVGSNVTLTPDATNDEITIGITKNNVTTALGYTPPNDDTKNTAGSTDTSSKIYLIGATSQATNPQTYSQDTAYVGTDGCLYSGGNKVLTSHQDISGKVSKTGDTVSGTLVLSKRGDASGTADNSPALIVGGTVSQTHIEMDENEIVAKSDATHGADLFLNYDGGGSVHIGPNATVIVGDNSTRVKGNLNLNNNLATGYLDSDGNVANEQYRPVASGSPSFSLGYYTSASGYSSLAHGSNCRASGKGSHAEGYDCKARGDTSHAEGAVTSANGSRAHSEGSGTSASGDGSHAEGLLSHTNGTADYSHAEGHYTNTQGKGSHSEGNHTTAVDCYCHAEGAWTIARIKETVSQQIGSHADGYKTVAEGLGSYTHGYMDSGQTSPYNNYYDNSSIESTSYPPIYAEGNGSTAFGKSRKITQIHAYADGSLAHGYIDASADSSTNLHGIFANGQGAHAEGYVNATAEGKIVASGKGSHAEGNNTTASGDFSHAEGKGTVAQRASQTVIGEFNTLDTTGADGTAKGSYAFIIGNGTSGTRSNALTVDWNGNLRVSGAVYANEVNLKDYIDTQISNAITQVLAASY